MLQIFQLKFTFFNSIINYLALILMRKKKIIKINELMNV